MRDEVLFSCSWDWRSFSFSLNSETRFIFLKKIWKRGILNYCQLLGILQMFVFSFLSLPVSKVVWRVVAIKEAPPSSICFLSNHLMPRVQHQTPTTRHLGIIQGILTSFQNLEKTESLYNISNIQSWFVKVLPQIFLLHLKLGLSKIKPVYFSSFLYSRTRTKFVSLKFLFAVLWR